ncbi:hypothetical protein ACH5RR_006302 [Cinchona calisaya]|uniref:Uncharacterized protein n=1 Tax=Cinchona calisaya TaxID=153742 RepID=A0ABD3ANN0_9GENT
MGNTVPSLLQNNHGGETLLACISGQSASLVPTRADGRDLENSLARALRGRFYPVDGVNVLRVDRNELRRLAEYDGSLPITFRVTVDGHQTTLNIEYYELINNSIIILNVEGQQIMMDGNGNRTDWNAIRKGDYGWNLGSGNILVSSS